MKSATSHCCSPVNHQGSSPEVLLKVNCSRELRAGRHLTPEGCRIVSCEGKHWAVGPFALIFPVFLVLSGNVWVFNFDPLSFLRIQRLRCHLVTVQGLFTLVYECSSLELAHTVLTITSREFCLESICICFEGTFGIWRCLELTLDCTIWTFSIWCHLKGSDKDRFSSWVYWPIILLIQQEPGFGCRKINWRTRGTVTASRWCGEAQTEQGTEQQ